LQRRERRKSGGSNQAPSAALRPPERQRLFRSCAVLRVGSKPALAPCVNQRQFALDLIQVN